ncbi:hypothetical protein DPMN_088366 [Dreissena polymorpha]|uniref:Uncharacterized protein n=1 Tax=Dreissena polymorpha TaxID=45954 RepID=A0A9D4KVR0_DREPO|nr:hypothetical protein DPMN_088366 [Dreissena polymorpha]
MSKPPSKQEREICYQARNIYFKCLDANDDDPYKCVKQRDLCEMRCPKKWVKYFEDLRLSQDFKTDSAKVKV